MSLRADFMLDPEIAFLNHGFVGATPRAVFEANLARQREFEREPVDFISRFATQRLAEARASLAAYVDADADDLVFTGNGTIGLNMVARSLNLGPGDDLLMTDHEHGGIVRLFEYLAERRGFALVTRKVLLPVTTHADFVDHLMGGVTERTRAILISHMTAPSALVLPVAEVCRQARALGIMTVVDGAHGPGQLPLSLRTIDPDFYVGILHKWLCAPKTAAFLYARRDRQDALDPLVVSWGWRPDRPGGSRFIDENEWQGSRDLSPFLTVPDAIAFQQAHNWDAVRVTCRALAASAQREIGELFGLAPWHPPLPEWQGQMACALLPDHVDIAALQHRLRFEHQIDVSVERFAGTPRVRVSVQGYNTRDDIDRLLAALRVLV
ncbi:MAG: aminotransferase class V-fold PLP-dependent enzyme [Novosphingobium sp.]